MSKQAMRDETERLVKEALERKTLTVKQGKTRIDSKCRKCGALNRVSADQGQVRVPYMCKECGEKQRTFWQRSTRGLTVGDIDYMMCTHLHPDRKQRG
jgi:RNase P subunit RPR2